MAATVAEVLWLLSLLAYQKIQIPQPITLFSNSMSAIHISRNHVFHERTKHIDIDFHFIREKVLSSVIKPMYLNTREQIADMFTKPLHSSQFHFSLSKLNIRKYLCSI